MGPLVGAARWIMPPAVLLFVLAVPQPGTAAKSGGMAAAASPRAVADVKLLPDRDYFAALLDGVDQARTEIFLSAFLFRTIEDAGGYPEVFLKRLLRAARRGVRVHVILERNRGADDLNRNHAETAERLEKGGVQVCLDAPNRVTHAKLVVIDGRYLLVGSHNLTQSALKYNHEVSVWIDSVPLADEALRYMKSICPGKPE